MLVKHLNLAIAVFVALTLCACSDSDSSRITAQSPGVPPAEAGVGDGLGHGIVHDDGLNWGPAPAIFPAGARFAVVQGNPGVPGEVFTVRLLFPNAYVHPEDDPTK
jgi:hypothetical protein